MWIQKLKTTSLQAAETEKYMWIMCLSIEVEINMRWNRNRPEKHLTRVKEFLLEVKERVGKMELAVFFFLRNNSYSFIT